MSFPSIRPALALLPIALVSLAISSNTLSSARAGLTDELIISPISHIADSLRSLTTHLENRIADLVATDSSMSRRLALPVVSVDLRQHLESMSYIAPVIFSPENPGVLRLSSVIDQQNRYIDIVLSSIDSRRRLVDRLPTLTPAVGTYTSAFGYRVHPISGRTKMHEGIDLSAPTGTPIRASGDGIVILAGRRNGYGNTVQIEHGFGYATLYGHCSRILVKEGDTVHRGQVIALVGSTGASTGPHLHYEVSVDGTKVAPDGFLIDAPVTPVSYDVTNPGGGESVKKSPTKKCSSKQGRRKALRSKKR